MNSPIIKMEDLTKIYSNGIRANDCINIQVQEREIVGVIGPNGAGKTTLIRQLLGLLKPTKGNIFLYGTNIKDKPGLIHETIGYVPQTPVYYPALSIQETVRYVLQMNGVRGKALEERMEITLKTLELENYAQLPGYQLSGGLQKAALLAVAWAKQAKVLVLDEPTSMVDVIRKQHFWEQIIKKSREEGRSILLSSHDLNEVKRICERIYLLVGGRIIAEGSAEKISQLLKMPVEMEFIPSSPKDLSSIRNKAVNWEQNGRLIKVAFQELEDSVTFLADLMKLGGIEYLKLEAPSFEKVVTEIIQNTGSEK